MWNKLRTLLTPNREKAVLLALLIISALAHGINMFGYPYYENDEGTYMSQAWAVLTQGKLAPYTYWYDHAPAGWLLISAWVKLTGGFFTFGPSVNSGRVLMLVLHLLSCIFVYYIAKKISKNAYAGIISVLIFSLSPLGIYFQRRVLLDNIMTFWVLGSLALLLRDKLKLSHIIFSAVAFGIAVLTKENAIFFIPAFLYCIWLRSHAHHKSFALIKWLAISGCVISLYFLYALIKWEFFPTGFMGDTSQHVSLIETLKFQFSRGSGLPFWDPKSDFLLNFDEWLRKDAFTILFGIVFTFIAILLSIKHKIVRVPALFMILFFIFLMRGKTVIDFYVVPIIPFFGLIIGSTYTIFADYATGGRKAVMRFLLWPVIVAVPIILLATSTTHFTKDETKPQLQALDWVFENVPKDSFIAIDDFAEVEYREKGYNAAWFWKVWYDPDIQAQFGNDWRNIEYLYLSHEMLRQIGFRVETDDILRTVFVNSERVAMYGPVDPGTYINFSDYQTTNGDWAAIYKLKAPEDRVLSSSWDYYKNNFIHDYGQVIDPASGNTTSEGQSYALLRSVWMDDKATFDGVWAWTRDHMQHRGDDSLLSWLWLSGEGKNELGDSGTASDADQDIALALLFAYKKWGDANYLFDARPIIQDIWKREVVEINGQLYLLSAAGAARPDGYLLNPSYLSPAHYRIFAQVDAARDWEKLAADSYTLLDQIGQMNGNDIYLPPNWIFVSKDGKLSSAANYNSNADVDNYGFDSFRTIWRVALDANWFNETKAYQYLDKIEPFYRSEWDKNKGIYAIYNLVGQEVVNFGSLSTTAAPLSLFSVNDKITANEVYQRSFIGEYKEEGFWGDKNNYYDQNWAWFASALYSNKLPNVWASRR